MKLQIIKLGRCPTDETRSLVAEYTKRLSRFVEIEVVEWKESALKKTMKAPGRFLVILDEKGKSLSSIDLSTKLQAWIDDPRIKELVFLIGGPYGLDQTIRDEADLKLRLSDFTLPSEIAWLVTTEQLYRAYTILKKMPYHHA